MAPSTRSSSAQNTPNTRSDRPTSTATTPADTPTKRAYTCRQCKRPKKGDHPRSGCPYVNDTPSEEEEARGSTEPLTNALGSMELGSPVRLQREEEDKAFIRNRRRLSAQPLMTSESLVSLSATSSELVARLLEPGAFDDHPEDANGNGKASKVVHWQDTVILTPMKKVVARSSMPGTLIPPTPDSSFGSSQTSFAKQESPAAHLAQIAAASSSEGSLFSGPPSPTPRAQPLTRTMSAVERDLFISKLTSETPATIYTIPKADVQSIQAQAAALKFIACPVMNDDEADPQALLILGRDEGAVQKLRRKIEEENKKASRGKAALSKASTFKAAAGGVVFGAVSTFAGLAFS